VITNDVSDYVTFLVRIAHIVCNHPIHCTVKVLDVAEVWKGRNSVKNITEIAYVISYPIISLAFCCTVLVCRTRNARLSSEHVQHNNIKSSSDSFKRNFASSYFGV